MRFSSKSEYGVRVLVSLGRRYGQGPVPLSEIARAERMPLPYLEQIMGTLRRAGLVVSRQGKKGGFELARPPSEVRMSEVVLGLEGGIAPMLCAVGERAGRVLCELEGSCTSQVLWRRIRDSILTVLETTTLDELIPPALGEAGARMAR
ncbi:MAG: Rrf2 family transcriptional regulator [Firmicutes bacterium]|nr:Rrf2 family transcriptional regulator [Bacillota bacterium]